MSQHNQSKSTFTLRISDGGGTFRCQATSSGPAGAYPRSALDITDMKRVDLNPDQSTTSASRRDMSMTPSSVSRMLTRQSNSAGTFRINSGASMFRIAG